MQAELRDDLKTALKSRDKIATAALRSALAAIANAEAVPVDTAATGSGGEHVAGAAVGVAAAEADRRELTDAQLREILDEEVRERTTAAAEYERLGHDEVAQRLRSEAAVLRRYLTAT